MSNPTLTLAKASRSCARRQGPVAWLLNIDARYRQRHALHHLTDTQLTDIGRDRSEADREAQKPAWDAPNWFRPRG